MVALPIPLLAASGLAVPLPSIVYRVAIGVADRTQAVAVGVPGLDAFVAGTTELPRRGTIRLSSQEVAEARAAATADRVRSTATSSPADEERARRVLTTRPAEPTVDAARVVSTDHAGWTDSSETAATAAPHAEAPSQPSAEASDGQSHVSLGPADERQEAPAPSSPTRSTPADKAPPRAEPPADGAPKSRPAPVEDEATVVVPGVPSDISDVADDIDPPSAPGRSDDRGKPSSETPPGSRGEDTGRPDTPPGQSQEPAAGVPGVGVPPGQSSGDGSGPPETPAPPGHSNGNGADPPGPPSDLPTPPETPSLPPKGQKKE